MILAFYDAFAEGAYLRLAWLLADSPILSCADNIWNQWCTISRQFLRVRQFSGGNLSEHVCSNACVSSIIMLLVCCFILKAGLRKNWITVHFSHMFISNFYREISKNYFCLDWVSHAMFSARFTANCWGENLVCVCFCFIYVWTTHGKSLQIDSERELARLNKVIKSPAPVVQTLDSAIYRINHYTADSVIDFRSAARVLTFYMTTGIRSFLSLW